MNYPIKTLLLASIVSTCFSSISHTSYAASLQSADHGNEQKRIKQAPMPQQSSTLPPTADQVKFNLPPSKKDPRLSINKIPSPTSKTTAQLMSGPPTADCTDMTKLSTYSGAALADYLVNLPDFECTYPLFRLSNAQAATIYSNANYAAIATRFAQEATNYNASNMALVNLTLYLRAGYFLSESVAAAQAPAAIKTNLRPNIQQLIDGTKLYQNNSAATTTAIEMMKLITNLRDEAYFLPSIKSFFTRHTNTSANPTAVNAILNNTGAAGYTGALIVMYYAHGRPDTPAILQDISYPTALNNFLVNNKAALLNTYYAYQLKETENEAFRFMQYPALKAGVKPMLQYQLANSSMTGADGDLWLGAATAVKYYDYANCSEYGTCNFEAALANVVLKSNYTCSPSIKIRAQDMSTAQLQNSCDLLAAEETYFHTMLVTNRTPLVNDNNKSLELVVFDDYTSYNKYAGIIYGIDTNNGGMYLEGNPADINNQARFIAHEASWLRPAFSVWNLEHEYIHYLDGRFNMAGDFGTATAKPTVWWIEGVAEYLSQKNNNQKAIDTAKAGNYSLSTIFGNNYYMSDYANRAYPWGYMAVRFMNEKHRSDIDAVMTKFRSGDYNGYTTYMANIGNRYDSEFASWVQTATIAGEPPLPGDPVSALPNCNTGHSYYLGNNCSLKNVSSSTESYVFIMVPTGAKNLKIFTGGGTGDVDVYVRKELYPNSTTYDAASLKAGNNESLTIANPTAGVWYYIMLKAKQPYSNVSVGASYE